MVNIHRRKWGREDIFSDGIPNPIHPSLPSLPPASLPESPHAGSQGVPGKEKGLPIAPQWGGVSGCWGDMKKWMLGIPSSSSSALQPLVLLGFLSCLRVKNNGHLIPSLPQV